MIESLVYNTGTSKFPVQKRTKTFAQRENRCQIYKHVIGSRSPETHGSRVSSVSSALLHTDTRYSLVCFHFLEPIVESSLACKCVRYPGDILSSNGRPDRNFKEIL